jgi:hypothetical protein
MWRLPFGDRWLSFTPPLNSILVLTEQTGHLLVQLTDLLVDRLQFLERHFSVLTSNMSDRPKEGEQSNKARIHASHTFGDRDNLDGLADG